MSHRKLPPLPDSFLFGVANSDHQCEAYDPAVEDIRDVWERVRGQVPRGRATDFLHRFPDDVEFARRMGCRVFRFSISWARVEPRPGEFSDAGFAPYLKLCRTLRTRGIEPMVTLHHFTWPKHIEERGGTVAPDFPAWFERYAAECAARLGDFTRYWITFNEPSSLVMGYIKPWWEANYLQPPGLPEGASFDEQIDAVAQAMRNLFVAHGRARDAIRAAHPEAQVGSNPTLPGLPVWLQGWINRAASGMRNRDDLVRQSRGLSRRPLEEHGEADVTIAMLTRTPDRAREVMFSEPYFVAGQRLLLRADSPSSSTLSPAPWERGQGVRAMTVAVVRTSTAEGAAARLLPGAKLLHARDHAAALAALDAGRADAFLADDVALLGRVAAHAAQYQLVGPRLTREPYCVAVTPGASDLLDAVDLVVRRFKSSGAWETSYRRHLPGPAPEPPAGEARSLHAASHAVPDGAALKRIRSRGYLVAAVRDDTPGFGYRDPATGEWSGLEIDLARELARDILGDPDRLRLRPACVDRRIPLLRSAIRVLDPLLKDWATLSTLLASNWWHLGMAGRLAEFLCPPECVGRQDFVGFDYYWGTRHLLPGRIRALSEAAIGHFDRAPVWPEALYNLIRDNAELFPGLPIWIVENGCVSQADGVDRAEYLRLHIAQVQRAVADGMNVAGYLCWSLTSNREWGLRFASGNDFGLYHVELDADPELRRVPTPSAIEYARIIAMRGVDVPQDLCDEERSPGVAYARLDAMRNA